MEPGAGVIFYEDRRGVWRVTWTLAYAFLMVSWLMQTDGAGLWPLFTGIALLLLGIGVSALFTRRKPLVGVEPEGLRLYAGRLGLAERGEAGSFAIPWPAIAGVAFEPRRAARRRGEEHPMTVYPLCFRLEAATPAPDGRRGFAHELVGRGKESAVGEHFLWTPDAGTLDLHGRPQGGFAALTAAIARAAPRLGDASAMRRAGLGGPLAYALYDAGVLVAVLGTLGLWATGGMGVYTELARRLFAWGGSLVP